MRWPMRWAWIWWADVSGPAEPLVRARWFDGRSSQAQPVLVGFAAAPPGQRGPDVLLHPVSGAATAASQRIAFKAIAWPEAWSARRVQRTLLVDLGAHGSLEVDDGARWHAALAAAGGRVSLVPAHADPAGPCWPPWWWLRPLCWGRFTATARPGPPRS
jgi:catechol 2,3-dioxygenase-like lactoylglutathione lyase family enzyme